MQRMFFRGSLGILLCLILVATTAGVALAASTDQSRVFARQTGPYAVANGAINVRGGPGVGFWILGNLNPSEIVPVRGISPDRAWWYVDTRFGPAWVAGISVTAYNTEAVPVYDPGLIGTVIAGALNVRTGAGPNAPSVGRLARNQQVFVQAQSADGTWLQIQWAYGSGWVSKAYISTAGTPAGVPADLTVASDKPYGMVTAAYLNVRSGPGINYTSLGYVYGGQELTIIGRNADSSWYQVETSFGEGWVSASFLLTRNEYGLTPVTSTSPEAEVAGPFAVVNTGAAHVRSGPGPQYTSLGMLSGGAQGQIIGRNADWSWWLVVTPLGTGWVYAPLVVVRGDSVGVPFVEPGTAATASAGGLLDGQGGFEAGAVPSAPVAEVALPVAVVTTGALNIRSGPNAVFTSLGSVQTGATLTIIGQSPDKGWWLVESPFGNGWISKAYVVVRGSTANVPVVN